MSTATILGCGVAGSWIAHHLASLGWSDFLLFDPAEVERSTESCKLLPHSMGSAKPGITKAENLAAYLKRLNPHAKIEPRGTFEVTRDLTIIRGSVVGAMSVRPLCVMAGEQVLAREHRWVTLGIPIRPGIPFLVSRDPSSLTDDYFGPPAATRQEIMRRSADAAALLLD